MRSKGTAKTEPSWYQTFYIHSLWSKKPIKSKTVYNPANMVKQNKSLQIQTLCKTRYWQSFAMTVFPLPLPNWILKIWSKDPISRILLCSFCPQVMRASLTRQQLHYNYKGATAYMWQNWVHRVQNCSLINTEEWWCSSRECCVTRIFLKDTKRISWKHWTRPQVKTVGIKVALHTMKRCLLRSKEKKRCKWGRNITLYSFFPCPGSQ